MSESKFVDIKGLIETYEFPCKLVGSGQELMIKPITTGQMKKILAYEDESDPYVVERALDKLISDCVITEDFNIDDLYLQDRFNLLLELRKVTKGNMYRFTYKCPKCGVENMVSIDLTKLEVVQRPEVDAVIPINDDLKFEVDYPTRGGQKNAVSRSNEKNLSLRERQIDIQTGTLVNCVKLVHTPSGILDNVPFEDKQYILDNIKSDVFDVFTDWFTDNEFGVVFKKDISCVSCMNEKVVDIPLNDFFI